MKVCPVCKREYPDDANFCSGDGAKLAEAKLTDAEKRFSACIACGWINPASAAKCSHCGMEASAKNDRVTNIEPSPKPGPVDGSRNVPNVPVDSLLSSFMPIEGVWIGHTTFKEAHAMPQFANNIIDWERYTSKHEPGYGHVEIIRRGNDNVVSAIKACGLSQYKDSWQREGINVPFDKIGLHKHLSFVNMYRALADMGFKITGVYHQINTTVWFSKVFNAGFTATSPANDFKVKCIYKSAVNITTVDEVITRPCLLHEIEVSL